MPRISYSLLTESSFVQLASPVAAPIMVYSLFSPHGFDMRDEYECETCDRKFTSQHATAQHMDALEHWSLQYGCETCDREFFTQRSAHQHMDDTGHWTAEFECESCDRRFYTQNSADQHMRDTRHWKPRFVCEMCDQKFYNQHSAEQHMDAKYYWKHRRCNTCKRVYNSQEALDQHFRDSPAHSLTYKDLLELSSKAKMIKDGWDDCNDVQPSHKLTKSPDDLGEGNRIIEAVKSLTLQ